MEQLRTLKPEQAQAIEKFKEYGATILIGFGNKALYHDLVHSNSYSKESISSKMADLRSRKNKQDEAIDAGDSDVSTTEFYVEDRNRERIEFSSEECLNYLRGIQTIRTHYEQITELRKLDAELNKIDIKSMTREERLKMEKDQLLAKRNKILGVVPEETKETA